MDVQKSKKRSKADFLGHGNMNKVLIATAIPSILAMMINAIYNITDTFFIGKIDPDNPAIVGAVSIAFPLVLVISAIGLGVGVGAASFVSRSLGAGNKEIANKTVTIAFITSLVLALFVTILGILLINPILELIGVTDTILYYAKPYSIIILFGSTFTILNMTFNNLIRAEGNAKYSMIAIMLGALLNIALDPLFIFVFDLGIKGAAIATVIGQMSATVFLLFYYFKHLGILRIDLKQFTVSKIIYLEILKIGLPTFITQFLTAFSMGLLNQVARGYGDPAIAGLGIALRVNSLLLFVIIGFKQGFQPIVGYNYGAQNYQRVKLAIRLSLIYTTIFSILSTIIFYIYAKDIIHLFNDDIETIKMGANQLVGVGMMRPFLGIILIYQGLFQALGKSRQAGVISIGRQGVFLILAVFLLPPLFIHYHEYLGVFINLLPFKNEYGLYGIAYTLPFAEFITLIITVLFGIKINKDLNYLLAH